MRNQSPPKYFIKFFRWFCHPKLRDSIEGDLMELYEERIREFGKRKADQRFTIDVLLLLRPSIIRPTEGFKTLNTYGMYKSYFKIGWRNAVKNKTLFSINVSGLALGIATCLMIMLFVVNELRYDRYNKKADQIARVVLKGKVNGETIKEAVTMGPVGPTLKEEFPEVLDATRIRRIGAPKITYQNVTYRNGQVAFVDPNFFEIFTLPIIQGDPHTALKEPNTMVITTEQARKFFGNEDPINKVVTFKDTNESFTITGVIEKVPAASHFHFDIFVSMEGLAHSKENKWLESNYFNYLLLAENTNLKALESKLPEIIDQYMGPQVEQIGMTYEKFRENGNEISLQIQPLTDIHLFSDFSGSSELEPGGDITSIYIFVAVAVFMLLIACINFMNLSTASATKRSKEVGVKKVLGSQKYQLINQFLIEAIISTIIAMILGIAIVLIAMPFFNQLSGKEPDLSLLLNPIVVGILFSLGFVISLLAGSYPAFYLASIKPITALKNKFSNGGKSKGMRSGLVVFQFVISATLILAIIVVSQQMAYIRGKDIGYKRDHRIVLRESFLLGNNEKVFKDQLLQDARIESVTMSAFIPAGPTDNNQASVWSGENKDNFRRTIIYGIDDQYIPTMGMNLVSGRNFSNNAASEKDNIIVNETLIRALGVGENPIGKTLYRATDNEGGQRALTIIGVIQDFHFRSLHEPIAPLMMQNTPYGGLIIKTNTDEIADLMASINRKWQSFNVEEPFTYALLDELYNETYQTEQKMGNVLQIFGLLTIFVACLGLFGLVTFTTEQRVKEIGIRKVMGANVRQIVGILSKELMLLVILSFFIAFPLGYYLMNKWLQDFVYRIEIQGWVFVLAGVCTLLIALFTLSFKTIKAGLANPIESLRSE